MKKYYCILLLFIWGCGRSLKQNWTNFTAYYNTFYNARQDFKAGLRKVNSQPIILNSSQFYRVFPRPASAGQDDFAQAINNGNQILRRFPNSKWTDDALLLVGKSYFYRRQYFQAIQKFESLLAFSVDSTLQPAAVFWKGRAQYEIGGHTKAIQFLQAQLGDAVAKWLPSEKAKVNVMLAEHFATQERGPEAAVLLKKSIPELASSHLKGRGELMRGQLLQKQDKYQQAYEAYSKVESDHPAYEYVYQANLRRGEIVRLMKQPARAIGIYRQMLGDDKNFKNHAEINYQMARAYQELDQSKRALTLFNKVLQGRRTGEVRPQIIQNTYYQLGTLYSRQFDNYQTAAAYFDSSSAVESQAPPRGRQLQQLAGAYRQYGSIKDEIARMDSLLQLGRLDRGALQKRMIEIRALRRQQMEQRQNAVQQTRSRLSNVDRRQAYAKANDDVEAYSYGFLNYRNAGRVQRSHQKFVAVWGSRPLVDNWRRSEAITGRVLSRNSDSVETGSPELEKKADVTDKELGVDMSEIPQTLQQRRGMQQDVLRAKYRLGSLFFVRLNQPDSARFYFRQILAARAPDKIEAQTLYALYEMEKLADRPKRAVHYSRRLRKKYPRSLYARRLKKNKNEPMLSGGQADSNAALRAKVHRLMALKSDRPADSTLAAKFRRLARTHTNSALAPEIYYQGIHELIQFAKQPDTTTATIDSILVGLPPPLNFRSYTGKNWDTVRGWLHDFQTLFPESPRQKQLAVWQQLLANPAGVQPPLRCKDIGKTPKIVGGKAVFVQSVKLPDRVSDRHFSGSVRYRMQIGKKGQVQSYRLMSPPTKLGIEEAFDREIEKNLQFKPIKHRGHAVWVSCAVDFPIKK